MLHGGLLQRSWWTKIAFGEPRPTATAFETGTAQARERTPRKGLCPHHARTEGVIPLPNGEAVREIRRGRSKATQGVVTSHWRHAQRGAPADVQHLAGDEAVVGREEHCRARHVFGRSHAAHGNALEDAFGLRAFGLLWRNSSVAMGPGPMALTVIPSRPSSMASVRVMPIIPALVAE